MTRPRQNQGKGKGKGKGKGRNKGKNNSNKGGPGGKSGDGTAWPYGSSVVSEFSATLHLGETGGTGSGNTAREVHGDNGVFVQSFGGRVDQNTTVPKGGRKGRRQGRTGKGGAGGPSGPIPSIFEREDDQAVAKRKERGGEPLNMDLRAKPLYADVPVDLDEEPALAHPARPAWTAAMSREELEQHEHQCFEEWKHRIREAYPTGAESLTPIEYNIDVWRQLWRTTEQAHVVLLVADIRNPLLHIPPSLVREVVEHQKKKIVVALTKIDLVSQSHTAEWLTYLQAKFPQIHAFVPFTKQPPDEDGGDPGAGGVASRRRRLKKRPKKDDPRVQVMTQRLLDVCTAGVAFPDPPEHKEKGVERHPVLAIGCVGHPNVGKSSVLNALVGTKKLSVSRTAGHTRHLQHIYLENPYGACVIDCPGLVFPMRQPRYIAEVCGLYPIAQIRETLSAVRFVAEHFPIERLYNLKKPDWREDEPGWSALSICEALAEQKGHFLARSGAPDVHSAGLEIIRDCVDGLVCVAFKPPILESIVAKESGNDDNDNDDANDSSGSDRDDNLDHGSRSEGEDPGSTSAEEEGL